MSEKANLNLTVRHTCRICGSKLTPVLSLGEQCTGSAPVRSPDEDPPRIPLELVRCSPELNKKACGLVQLRHSTLQDVLYFDYWYRSGINQTMRNHLAGVAHKAEQMVQLNAGDVVLDIGCNDGTLLRSYTKPSLQLVGIDPAKNIGNQPINRYFNGTDIKIVTDYFSRASFSKANPNSLAKVITSIAMFYDLEDPNSFVRDIKAILHTEGIWILEQHYLAAMLKWNAFDVICHEHLEYYALGPLEALLSRNSLQIVDVELNDINGGSFRLYVQHTNSSSPTSEGLKHVQELRKSEAELALNTSAPYKSFVKRIEKIRDDLRTLILSEHDAGKTIYVYGASTKGNTILQYCGLNSDVVVAAADRNPAKWGLLTPGTHIPIVSEEEARATNPDYFLVLPWHFLPEFLEREKEYLSSGGKFIVPLPEVKIISL